MAWYFQYCTVFVCAAIIHHAAYYTSIAHYFLNDFSSFSIFKMCSVYHINTLRF